MLKHSLNCSPICSTPSSESAIDTTSTTPGLGYAATPSISSYGNSSGIVWAIKNTSAPGSAVLYALDAGDLHELYDTKQCVHNSVYVDQPGPATKFSVPTIANGFVYIGTQIDFDIYGLTSRPCD